MPQHFDADQVLEDLGENPNVVEYVSPTEASFWRPGSTKGRVVRAKRVRYIRFADGGIDLQIIE